MAAMEKYISDQVLKIIPSFEKLEFRAYIGDDSYSIEFFVTIDKKRKQCYDMVDEGLIKEQDLDTISEAIADYIRNSSNYEKGKINEISVVIMK